MRSLALRLLYFFGLVQLLLLLFSLSLQLVYHLRVFVYYARLFAEVGLWLQLLRQVLQIYRLFLRVVASGVGLHAAIEL